MTLSSGTGGGPINLTDQKKRGIKITPEAVYCHDDGLIIMDAMLCLQDPAKRPSPPAGQAVWLVVQDPDGKLCWELGEWHDGSALFSRGWYLVGLCVPFEESHYTLRYWCHEPPLPKLEDLPNG